jgi:hypothetical protein
VSKTPNVASDTPCHITGLISLMRVERPPENKMTHRHTVPMVCAVEALSNCMPKPSLPQIIPISKKSRRAGVPNRELIFPDTILTKNRSEKINSTLSIVMVFDVYFMSRLQYFVTNLRKKEKKTRLW